MKNRENIQSVRDILTKNVELNETKKKNHYQIDKLSEELNKFKKNLEDREKNIKTLENERLRLMARLEDVGFENGNLCGYLFVREASHDKPIPKIVASIHTHIVKPWRLNCASWLTGLANVFFLIKRGFQSLRSKLPQRCIRALMRPCTPARASKKPRGSAKAATSSSENTCAPSPKNNQPL